MIRFQPAHFAIFACLAFASEACLQGDELASVPVLVNVLDEVDVSPREPGVLMKIVVHEGQQLKQAEVMGQLDDTQDSRPRRSCHRYRAWKRTRPKSRPR